MSEPNSHLFGIRIVAAFEAVKAVSLLAVGCGLFSLINHDLEQTATYLVKHLHLSPASRYPHIFIDAVSHISSTQIWMLALLALFDSVIRAVEAVGLWWEKDWGKWLGIVTASLYLPIELYEMAIHLTWLKTFTFVTNIIIVAYLAWTLRSPSSAPKNEPNG